MIAAVHALLLPVIVPAAVIFAAGCFLGAPRTYSNDCE